MKPKFVVWLIVAALIVIGSWLVLSPQGQDQVQQQVQTVQTQAQAMAARHETPEEIKRDEAKAKAAWNDQLASYQLCLAQNEVVEHYHHHLRAEGKSIPQPTATPACRDPGPFSYVANTEPQPLEGSGAHSPAEMAKQAPSSSTPASEQDR